MPPCSCSVHGCFLPILGRMTRKRANIWACAQRATLSSFSRQVNEVRAESRTLHLHASLHSAPCIMSCSVEMTIQGRGLKPLALQAPTVSTTDILPRTTADYIAHAERPTCPIRLHISSFRPAVPYAQAVLIFPAGLSLSFVFLLKPPSPDPLFDSSQ